MKALRFVLVAAAAALASLFLAAPAGATDTPGTIPVKPALPLFQCPRDGSIKLVKTADKTDYNLNEIVTFTLKVQASVCDATLVMVHDSLPAGLTVSDPSVLNHSFGSIAAGAEKSFSFQAVAVAKGQWTNKAHASGFSVGPDRPENLCGVRPPIDTPVNPVVNTAQTRIVVPPTFSCPRSSDAEVTVKVIAPTNTPPTPPPPPTQPTKPPGNPGTPSLPDTGRQG
jgi:uncharacterized repeat protein (TIGR01451 family)